MSRRTALVTFVVLVGTWTLSAQQAPQQPAPDADRAVFRAGIDYVEVDAFVVDARNNPISDLKAEEVEILEDGKPQKVSARIRSATSCPGLRWRCASSRSARRWRSSPSSTRTSATVRRTSWTRWPNCAAKTAWWFAPAVRSVSPPRERGQQLQLRDAAAARRTGARRLRAARGGQVAGEREPRGVAGHPADLEMSASRPALGRPPSHN